MYTEKEYGTVIYESLDELLAADVVWITEYKGYYYVLLKPAHQYVNRIWKVDKKTGEVYRMMYTQYILDGLTEKATHVDPETLKGSV